MFWKKLKKKEAEKHNYDLTYDNVAIPEAFRKFTPTNRKITKKLRVKMPRCTMTM